MKIYTAGKMSGLSYEDQMAWRRRIDALIRERTNKTITFIHPPLFYQYDDTYYQSQQEVKNWELNQVRDCDVLIVNLDGVNESVGTHYELSTVDAVNSFGNKHIYVIGVGGHDDILYPWIELSLHRRENSLEDAADYIANYLLI